VANRAQKQNKNKNQTQYQNQVQNMDNAKTVMDEEEFIAKLSTMGGVIQTIGGIMSTAASFLALQKFQRDIILEEEEPVRNNVGPNDNRISELEKQIQYLIKEIDDLKRQKS